MDRDASGIPRPIFKQLLFVVKTLSRESGHRSYPHVELVGCTSADEPGKQAKKWSAVKFPVIRTENPERSQEWEYFTLGYDRDGGREDGQGLWWYIFSGSGGCYFSHPFIRNPFNDSLGAPHFGCIIIENIEEFVFTKLKGVLYDYTCTMPLDLGESFLI